MAELSRTFIITNDDGVDAPGIAALFEAAEAFGIRRVIAPDGPQSGCGHAVTTSRAIRFEKRGTDRIAVFGTPADCVRLGIHHLAPGTKWVLSGVNAGGNLGVDVHHSGTVAAVREAVIHGVPGIALSHYIARGKTIDWAQTTRWTARILEQLLDQYYVPGTFWNVNFPHLDPGTPEPEIVFCPIDPSPLPLSFQVEEDSAKYDGVYHARARVPGGDVYVCFRGQIAVSRVRLIPSDDSTA
jgi:5'-nucleotidase